MTNENKATEVESGVYFSRGQTAAQIDQERLKRIEADAEVFPVEMSRKEIRELAHAAEDTQYMLFNAANVFDFLNQAIMNGGFSEAGITATLEICDRGFRHAAETEGEKLAVFAHQLRTHEEYKDAAI